MPDYMTEYIARAEALGVEAAALEVEETEARAELERESADFEFHCGMAQYGVGTPAELTRRLNLLNELRNRIHSLWREKEMKRMESRHLRRP